jgi:SAM-dependent methyltransferase
VSHQTNHLRTTFEQSARIYHDARPGYPEELFDDLVALSGIPLGGRVLEIGCGTGLATLPLARRGYSIHCIELGEQLAAVAREHLAAYPAVSVEVGMFEKTAVEEAAYDLAVSATAWHWIPQPAGYRNVAKALRPGGSIAIWRHEHVWSAAGGDFWIDVQELYERHMPGTEPGLRLQHPDAFTGEADAIDASGLFGPVTLRRYVWDIEYDAESYLRLLSTYSGHIDLAEPNRTRLFQGIADLINGPYGGRIVKGYMAILHVARRL